MKKLIFSIILFSSVLMLFNCDNPEGGDKAISNPPPPKEDIKIELSQETVEINGVKHFVEKMGSGEPLLVLHGGPGLFHNYLVPHFKNLAKHYQIIFYDQRGCGKTDFPQDTSSIKLDTYVDDLEAMRSYLKIDKLNLVGHSWGSLLAITYAKKYPNKLNRLILISPTPANTDYFNQTFSNMQEKRSDEDTEELVHTMMSVSFEKREEKAFRKAILLGDKVNLVNQDKISELYEPMKFTTTTANNLMLVNSLLEKTYYNFDIIEGLELITCPTLIIYGDLDNVPFSSIQSIHDNIKNSRLEVIKKSCNYPFFESPKEFNRVFKNFLNPDYEE